MQNLKRVCDLKGTDAYDKLIKLGMSPEDTIKHDTLCLLDICIKLQERIEKLEEKL